MNCAYTYSKLKLNFCWTLGRQFGYDRALEIIQDEEYLDDVDFEEIRRYDILKKIGNFDSDVNIPGNHHKSKWQNKLEESGTQKLKYSERKRVDIQYFQNFCFLAYVRIYWEKTIHWWE